MNEANLELASRGARLGGAILDSLIMMPAAVLILFLAGILQNALKGIPMTTSEQALMLLFGAIVFLVFNGYLLYTRGQTIGKVIVNVVPFCFPSLKTNAHFIYGKEKRCIHDYLAGPRVVKV